MAEGVAVGAIVGLISAMSAHKTGKRQAAIAKEGLKKQDKRQAQAVSAAGSKRIAQESEARALRKKKPKMSAILARRRAAAQQGVAGTFLTGSSGSSSPGIGGAYSLGD